MQKQKIALVLSGGGARGLAHIGAIEALERAGFVISAVAGTSMGALIGGMYAAGRLPRFREWVCGLDRYRVFGMVDFAFSSEGLVKGNRIMKALQSMVPEVRIENLAVPFSAVAADLLTGREVVFDHGGLFDAIRASISIPSVFRPVRSHGMVLIDGGTVNPLPLNRVVRQPGDRLVAVDVGGSFSGLCSSLNYYNLLSVSSEIMIQQISRLMCRFYPPDLLVDIPCDLFGLFEFYRAAEIIEAGRRLTTEALRPHTVVPAVR
ncbi:MAG: phospholipase [Alistipes sp.]|nr:phospholipase [Alistipes sp.]